MLHTYRLKKNLTMSSSKRSKAKLLSLQHITQTLKAAVTKAKVSTTSTLRPRTTPRQQSDKVSLSTFNLPTSGFGYSFT